MKIELKPMLLFIGASSAIFWSCQKTDSLTSPASQSSTVQSSTAQSSSVQRLDEFLQSTDESSQTFSNAYSENMINGISVWLTTTTVTSIGNPPVVLKTGTFVASHELGDTGLYVMHVKFFGPLLDSIHCVTTMYPNKGGGSWMTDSRCSIVTNIGKWIIIHGAGRYWNLRGRGTVDMIPGHEMAKGKIRYD